MKVLVEYAQMFNGEVLTDSYKQTISRESEISEIYQALYEDDHVFDVEVTIIEESDLKITNHEARRAYASFLHATGFAGIDISQDMADDLDIISEYLQQSKILCWQDVKGAWENLGYSVSPEGVPNSVVATKEYESEDGYSFIKSNVTITLNGSLKVAKEYGLKGRLKGSIQVSSKMTTEEVEAIDLTLQYLKGENDDN